MNRVWDLSRYTRACVVEEIRQQDAGTKRASRDEDSESLTCSHVPSRRPRSYQSSVVGACRGPNLVKEDGGKLPWYEGSRAGWIVGYGINPQHKFSAMSDY